MVPFLFFVMLVNWSLPPGSRTLTTLPNEVIETNPCLSQDSESSQKYKKA